MLAYMPRVFSMKTRERPRVLTLEQALGRSETRVRGLLAEVSTLTALLEEAQRKNALLEKQAMSDLLTGLGNRAAYESAMKRRASSLARGAEGFSVVFIDINGLKTINDTLGHKDGDKLIMSAAGAIKNAIRGSDEAFRIGGDEFVVLLDGSRSADVFIPRLTGITSSLGNGLTVAIGTASTSESQFRDLPTEKLVSAILHEADERMYHMKKAMKEARR